MARTTIVIISPRWEGGSTKLDLVPEGGATPGTILALDAMLRRDVRLAASSHL